MLTLTSLSKSVTNSASVNGNLRRTLFADLNFTVAAGEFVAITGESGVGKSTLLNLIAGLDTPDAGTVALDGVNLAALDDDARTWLRRERMGFVFQAFHILPHLTLAQNVALPLVLQQRGRAVALREADRLLEAVGLTRRGSDFPNQLSGGELQRVAIARALIHKPALLLADEPTGNLDPETAARIMDLLRHETRLTGAATLLVTHSAVAAANADRIVILTANGLANA